MRSISISSSSLLLSSSLIQLSECARVQILSDAQRTFAADSHRATIGR